MSLAHEVIDGKCHSVMLSVDASGKAKARSSEAGAKVEWHEVEEGKWHSVEECTGPIVQGHVFPSALESPAEPHFIGMDTATGEDRTVSVQVEPEPEAKRRGRPPKIR